MRVFLFAELGATEQAVSIIRIDRIKNCCTRFIVFSENIIEATSIEMGFKKGKGD